MNRCKTCKWWKCDTSKMELTYNPNDAPDSRWQDRTPTRAIPIQHECGNEHVSSRDPSGMVDSEDYGGVFTGPDFGCIHYEETQEQLPQEHPGYVAQQELISRRNRIHLALPLPQ